MSVEKRKRGRPRRNKGEKTLPALGFRPAADTRRLLEEHARVAGHSLSHEVDLRLRQVRTPEQKSLT